MDDEGLEETERSSKMNQVKTVENMMNKDEFKKCIERLKSSTIFHMSLGSKELFHSNFLHWISIVNWSAFLEIMHGLADTKKFWWEKIDEKDPCKCPKDIKVFREHRNFDLSIYILDSEKEVVDNSNNDKVINDDTTSEYTQNFKGKRMVQKWIPVLVLENKMKSLPYKAQLEEYTKKAYEEWRKGEKLIKPSINELKQNSEETEENVSQEWITNHGITFILLSLMDTNIGSIQIKQCLKYKKNQRSIIFEFAWKRAIYSNLVDILDKIDMSQFSYSILNQLVLNDYNNYLKALCALAETWRIIPKKSYRCQIAPWKINNVDAAKTIQEIEQYKELRIHDIHEKLLYDQLLNLLESGLKHKFERYNAKTNQINFYNKGIKIFTNLSYAHGIGIFEVQYFIEKMGKPNDKESFFKLIIQVQGDRYCHMVINDGIVLENKDENGEKELRVNKEAIVLKKVFKPIANKLGEYISIDGSQPVFLILKEPSWGQYGKNNIYQYVKITPEVTVQEVIDAIIQDIEKIEEWFKS